MLRKEDWAKFGENCLVGYSMQSDRDFRPDSGNSMVCGSITTVSSEFSDRTNVALSVYVWWMFDARQSRGNLQPERLSDISPGQACPQAPPRVCVRIIEFCPERARETSASKKDTKTGALIGRKLRRSRAGPSSPNCFCEVKSQKPLQGSAILLPPNPRAALEDELALG